MTDKTIRIGIHAPVTGAAPFPQKAFELSNDLYWKYLADKGGVHGRNVEVVFRDDKYNPTSAVQACREMVEQAEGLRSSSGSPAPTRSPPAPATPSRSASPTSPAGPPRRA